MKSIFTILALAVVIFTSCTSAYKTGQTPDDVYYSPARPVEEYVRTEKEESRVYDDEYYEDRQLRMKVRNRTRWSELDDWYYNPRYNYYTSYGTIHWSSPWNYYTHWNYYYNPYCPKGGVVVVPKGNTVYNRPRSFNLNVYNPRPAGTNAGIGTMNTGGKGTTRPISIQTNTGSSRRDAGSTLRDIFSGGSSNRNSSSGSTSTQSSSSSSGSSRSGSSGSSGGGSAPVRKF